MIYHLTISVEDDPDFPYDLRNLQYLLEQLEKRAEECGCNLYDSSFDIGD